MSGGTNEDPDSGRLADDSVPAGPAVLLARLQELGIAAESFEHREIDLKALGERIGAGRLSFGSAERLMKYLGVLPGAVTPFGVLNDRQGKVAVVLDSALPEQDPVNCHPLVNTMTTALSGRDLVRFLESTGHSPQLLDFTPD